MSIPTPFNPMGTLGGGLPPGYSRLMYLRESGTQWIDTGIKPSDFSEFEVKFKVVLNPANAGDFFGVNNTSGINQSLNSITVYKAGSANWFGYGAYESEFNLNNNDDVLFKIDQSRAFIQQELNSKTLIREGSVINNTMRLFRSNGAGANKFYQNRGLLIYYARFAKGGKNVANFIPALSPTGRPCMFDLITRTPFYNAGTGEFLYA